MCLKTNVGALLAACILAGCSASPAQREAKFLRRGNESLGRNDLARALLDFRNAAQAMPADAEPYYRIALVNLQIGDMSGAFAGFSRALELNPDHVDARLKLAGLMATSADSDLLQQGEQRLKQ